MFALNIDLIKSKIDQLDKTQYEIAELIGTTSTTLSLFLNGKTKTINLNFLYELCRILNLKIEQVIIDNSEPANINESFYINKIEQLTEELNNTIKEYKTYQLNKTALVQYKLNKLKDKCFDDEIYKLDKDDFLYLIDLLKNNK